MFNFCSKALTVTALTAMLTGCIDDKYDLSDIDTTTQLQVKDLVLPINIDPVTLGDIISLSPDSKVQIIDGQYVFYDGGDFTSEPVKIKEIKIDPAPMNPDRTTVYVATTEGSKISYDIYSSPIKFKYSDQSISDDILDLKRITCMLPVTICVALEEFGNVGDGLMFENLVISLPKGMKLENLSHGSYNPTTGILQIAHAQSSAATSALEIKANMTALDVDACDEATFVPSSHSFVFDGTMKLDSGTLSMTANSNSSSHEATLVTTFTLGTLNVKTIDGRIKYTYEGFSFDPIKLTNLPDLLTQPQTDITLLNPQIYLNITNGLSPYNVHGQAALSLTPSRNNVKSEAIETPNPFEITGAQTTVLCLSPAKPESFVADYASATWNPYPRLGEILKGNGIPTEINVEIKKAEIPAQDVPGLPIGESIGAVDGKYYFYAPIAFNGNSQIVYSKTTDGWNDEDVDKIAIDKLEVTALATNNSPFDILVTGYPIDINGNRINNVDITGATIPVGSNKDTPLTITTTGKVTHLDGFVYEATFLTKGETKVLSPTDNIVLNNIRVKVTGTYTKEL